MLRVNQDSKSGYHGEPAPTLVPSPFQARSWRASTPTPSMWASTNVYQIQSSVQVILLFPSMNMESVE